MIKVNNCKELNWIEHYEILERIENIKVNNIVNEFKGSTVKLINNKDNRLYCIIHKCTKIKNKIQLSYFDNKGAYSDKVVNDMCEAIAMLYKSYKVCEVI